MNLYVGTVNGENSWFNKSADTYAYGHTPTTAAFKLFRRYLKKIGVANVTEMFLVDKKNKKITRVPFTKI